MAEKRCHLTAASTTDAVLFQQMSDLAAFIIQTRAACVLPIPCPPRVANKHIHCLPVLFTCARENCYPKRDKPLEVCMKAVGKNETECGRGRERLITFDWG